MCYKVAMTVTQPLILFYTDFGTDGPYLGQMEAAILDEALQSRVINLLADAPSADPRRAAYLLAALTSDMPPGCVVVAVVDPGVGTTRRPLIVESAGRVYVGPDNGLLSRVVASDQDALAYRIDWRPQRLSNTFHGRDLFAPVAGLLSIGQNVERTAVEPESLTGMDWPDELDEVIYVDHFGNAMTGLRARGLAHSETISVGGQRLAHASTFADARVGECFWYGNSCGLVEVSANQASAAEALGLAIGDIVTRNATGS